MAPATRHSAKQSVFADPPPRSAGPVVVLVVPPPPLVVVEVVEQSSHWNSAALARGLAELREAGARVALDDVGFGHSNLQMVIELRPDLLKLDRYFVVGAGSGMP